MRFLFKFDKNLFEMARVGWVPIGSEKTVEVYIRTDDAGMTPHFHLRKYGKKNKFIWETCIKFTEPEYFLHGKYNDTISTDLAKDLDNMLRKDNPKDPGRTYWETAIIAWNNNNSSMQLDNNIKQPDYTKLNS